MRVGKYISHGVKRVEAAPNTLQHELTDSCHAAALPLVLTGRRIRSPDASTSNGFVSLIVVGRHSLVIPCLAPPLAAQVLILLYCCDPVISDLS